MIQSGAAQMLSRANRANRRALALVASWIFLGMAVAAPASPNVLVIMADDLGYGSINAYAAPRELVRTPHLNRLADSGMRFTDANTPGATCSPTRYALLTGRYAWRGPLPFGVVNVFDPLVVETDRQNLGRFFQEAGYQTAQIGKWHLGYTDQKRVDFTGRLTPGPNDLGFDYHFGLPQNLDDMLRVWIENDGVHGLRSKTTSPYAKSFYGTPYLGLDAPQRNRETAMEELTNRAIDWIRRAHRADPERPFFLLFTPPAVHHPIVPSEPMRGTSGCGAYGDFIHDLDHSVGRLLETLEYEGIGNTLVVFTSDNGGDIPGDPQRPEGQAIAAGLKINGNLRGDKHTIWEGGCRVPLILHWQGKIEGGGVSDRMVSIADLFATLAEIVAGKPVALDDAIDSSSFAPTLFGRPQPPRNAMVTSNAAGLLALRDDEWKYIDPTFPASAPKDLRQHFRSEAVAALYHLRNDPAEQHNVIDQYPENAKRLRERLERYRQGAGSR